MSRITSSANLYKNENDSQELTSVKMFTQYNFIEGIYTSKYIRRYEP